MKAFSTIFQRFAAKVPQDLVELDEWRRRLAMLTSAVLIGVLATLFAWAADFAQRNFAAMTREEPYAPLLLTPFLFVAIAALTRSLAPASRGSGIPQVIADSRHPEGETTAGLLSARTLMVAPVRQYTPGNITLWSTPVAERSAFSHCGSQPPDNRKEAIQCTRTGQPSLPSAPCCAARSLIPRPAPR